VNSPKSLSLAFRFFMLMLSCAIQSKQCLLFQFDPFPLTLTTTWKSIPLHHNSIVTRLIAKFVFYDCFLFPPLHPSLLYPMSVFHHTETPTSATTVMDEEGEIKKIIEYKFSNQPGDN